MDQRNLEWGVSNTCETTMSLASTFVCFSFPLRSKPLPGDGEPDGEWIAPPSARGMESLGAVRHLPVGPHGRRAIDQKSLVGGFPWFSNVVHIVIFISHLYLSHDLASHPFVHD